MSRIGVVIPTFTAAAYSDSPNYYDWYNKYVDENEGEVSSELNMLSKKIPSEEDWFKYTATFYAQTFFGHLKKSRPSDQVSIVTDTEIHKGGHKNYDILIIFHEEYVTENMYNNFQTFVAEGGVLVAMDGNVFFCEVLFSEADNVVTLSEGHFWKFDGKRACKGAGERWKEKTSQWFGSNSDAGPEIRNFSYLLTKFDYNPFRYPRTKDNAGAENQYISSKVDVIIVDYKASVNEGGKYLGQIATYAKNYGKGRSVVFGIYTDQLQSDPAFLKFFDIVFEQYAIQRSNSSLPIESVPISAETIDAAAGFDLQKTDGPSKQGLEEKIRNHMLERRIKK